LQKLAPVNVREERVRFDLRSTAGTEATLGATIEELA
jgi:hypothetical protein